ncbi:leucine-rich repeat-containing protein 72-like [Haliotis cracherodii]|uniref:leucine-rich repeat-containing protein 72-like n=1 Tax=Haliotis cracherodii TaxID=6455 RepID=UPI0039E964AB
MAASEKVLKQLLSNRRIRKDKDVEELYLSDKSLTEVCDLQRFRYLRCLWLNGNKLRQLNCLSENYQLSELYLHNNELVDITGAFHHLTCLQVLMLHNNQLTKLDRILTEIKKMQSLKTLNLFNNPMAQESGYRLFVVQSVPSVDLLDRKEVLKSERDKARKIYNQEQEKISDTVAFGRRSGGPPLPSYNPLHIHIPVRADPGDIGNSYLRECPPNEDPEEAVNARRLNKSITIYTSFDWSKVPRIKARRTAEEMFDSPEIITHVYR